MSDMTNEPVESAAVQTDMYDYLAEPKAESKPVEVEVKSKDEEVTDTEEESEESNEDNKPWKGKKSDTPSWAKKRFKEYSTTVRELKDQNHELMQSVRDILAQNKPQSKELTLDDFPDSDAYMEHRAKEITDAKLAEYDQHRQAQEQQASQLQQIQALDAQNVEKAREDLPDYEEAIQSGDPDIRVPANVMRHLAMSPAGPYVKYRLATDDQFADQVKSATPEQRVQLISEVHDSVLDYLIKRNGEGTPSEADATVEAKPAVPAAPTKKTPPKAPPTKVRGKSTVNINELTGDAYVRARNEQLSKR